ncbi:MAG: insulinase family protein, partial [Verrucomicrobiales bacterium]|nr:insulinase family protein [Verrucomicrobiales bacterium]
VLLLSDSRVPFIQATGSFRGGLLAENAAQNGITRLAARLLIKDTKHRSEEEIADLVESKGGGISASFGNNTFGVGIGAMRPDLEMAVDLLGETLLEPAFLPETVDREKQFQIANIRAENDRPFTVSMRRLRGELYGDHPYGLERSGTEESVSGLLTPDLDSFRNRLVTGKNGVVAVFGDLDLAKAEDLVRERFEASMPAGERAFTEPVSPGMPPENSYGQIAEITHEKEQAILLIGYRTGDLMDPDSPALELIDEACSDMASRMFIRIREELGLAYSVGATRILGLEPGCLIFYVATDPQKLDLVQAEMLDEIQKIVEYGLDQAEFDRAKSSWLGGEIIQLQGARQLAARTTVDELVGLGWDHYRKTPDVIRALTRETIQDTARKYFREENRVIVRLTTG